MRKAQKGEVYCSKAKDQSNSRAENPRIPTGTCLKSRHVLLPLCYETFLNESINESMNEKMKYTWQSMISTLRKVQTNAKGTRLRKRDALSFPPGL